MVWKLDRLARSLRQLVRTVEELAARDVGLQCNPREVGSSPYASAEDRGVFRAEFGGGVLPVRKRQAGVPAYAA